MRLFGLLITLIALGGCGNTWEGVKQDSSDIGRKVGETVQEAGEAIKEASD